MQTTQIETLMFELEQELLRLGYSHQSLLYYKREWNHLLAFAKKKKQTVYSEKLGIEFLEARYNILEKNRHHILKQCEVQRIRVIRMLGDFQLHRTILRRYYKHKKLLHARDFIEVHNKFKNYCIKKSYATETINHYTKISERFLDYLDSQKIISCQDITLKLINNYIRTLAGYAYKTVEQQLCALRAFFKYLFQSQILSEDFSTKIPMVKSRKQTRIPSVWTIDDLKKLIAAIDRGNPTGKRDYAIILLACRLGLRVKDIKMLTFKNFDWGKKELTFLQSKTKKMLSIPIPDDVGWAIIDYLKYGRPNVDCSYLFIRHLAPFLPFSEDDHLYQIIAKYMKIAHIPLSPNKKVGMHSLRHTLASVLLENETDLSTISTILGHLDMESTGVYLKVDINKLKACAMDIQEECENE